MIAVLDKETIDKIAAGEVVERPASIVKELLENAVDAGATAITVEIKDGGISLIRITDNGCGIKSEELRKAFLRHATSKIAKAEDLESVLSLGFRGEALSSISAVTRTQMISKTKDSFSAAMYKIEGGRELAFEEVAAPEGTSIIVRDLFYNTPARRKFLKSAGAEAAYISEMVEKLALSHPHISFRYINNNVHKLDTSGNGSLRDIIYQIYGKEASAALLDLQYRDESFSLTGFIAKPEYNKAKRSGEIYFVNGRYIRNQIIAKALEDAYGTRMMQGRYPFAVFHLELPPSLLDVNVHPNKMELRFADADMVYSVIKSAVENTLLHAELVRRVSFSEKERTEEIKRELERKLGQNVLPPAPPFPSLEEHKAGEKSAVRGAEPFEYRRREEEALHLRIQEPQKSYEKTEQLRFLEEKSVDRHRILGQLFDTYWIVELGEEMYIIDQHAAHEKVYYEEFLKAYENAALSRQYLAPALIISLSETEIVALENHRQMLENMGFEWESFGGREYKICAVPSNLPSVDKKDLFTQLLAALTELPFGGQPEPVLAKLASLSCKAAIKGNQRISREEAQILITKMLQLQDPYHCPHGRPTIIKMSKYDLEKKFKRIV